MGLYDRDYMREKPLGTTPTKGSRPFWHERIVKLKFSLWLLWRKITLRR